MFSTELPPKVGTGVRIFAAGALGPVLAITVGVLVAKVAAPAFGWIAGVAVEVGLIALARVSGRRRVQVQVWVSDRAVRVETAGRSAELQLSELEAIIPSKRALTLVSTEADALVVPADSPGKVATEVLRRVQAHPQGAAITLRMQLRGTSTRRLTAGSPWATWIIAALMVLAFGLEVATGALTRADAMIRLGGGVGRLLLEGQLNRPIVANFLHVSALHLFMNLSSVLALNQRFERWAGWYRLVPLVFISGVAGSLTATLWHPQQIVVGMSTALYGLLGAAAVTSYTWRRARLDGIWFSNAQWVQLGLVNGIINLLPGVSLAAHLGGLVSGALAALVFLRTPARPAWVPEGMAKALAFGMILLVFLAVVATGVQALLDVAP